MPRLAVLCDFPEEGWPSMDLCAEMLLAHLANPRRTQGEMAAVRLCPRFRRRFGRLPGLGNRPAAFNADRLVNRHYDYPRFLRSRTDEFDFFHIVDHSYAHLVHVLPPSRTGVYCHDLDTFRCLLDPEKEPRPAWFRRMARRKLDGLQKAAVVFYTAETVRKQIETYGLVDPARLVRAPYGVCPEFTPEDDPASGERKPPVQTISHWLYKQGAYAHHSLDGPFLLHVGSCIERKRMDVLLDMFAAVRKCHPDLRLVQVGGSWTPAQRGQIEHLGIGAALVQIRGLSRSAVADLYRRAAMLLLPSEAEGFGLPLIEGLACGAIVVASDLPVLREVGGPAALYRPVGDVAGWAEIISGILNGNTSVPERDSRLRQAGRYSWQKQAAIIADAYNSHLTTFLGSIAPNISPTRR